MLVSPSGRVGLPWLHSLGAWGLSIFLWCWPKNIACFKLCLIVYRWVIPSFLALNFFHSNYFDILCWIFLYIIRFIHWAFLSSLSYSRVQWCNNLLIPVFSWFSGLEDSSLTIFFLCLAFKIQLEMYFFFFLKKEWTINLNNIHALWHPGITIIQQTQGALEMYGFLSTQAFHSFTPAQNKCAIYNKKFAERLSMLTQFRKAVNCR